MPSPETQPHSTILCRPLRADEVDEACAVARAVFDAHVAPDQPAEGRRMFHAFAQPAALLQRHRTRYATWVAVDGPRVVGLLHLHARNHISLLFTTPECQRRGIATQLLRTAAEAGGFVAPATVNSSPNAVSYYARIGFAPEGPELLKNGVRHQPMRLAALPAEWPPHKAH